MAANAWTKEAQERSIPHANKNGEYWDQRDVDLLFNLFDQDFTLEVIAEALERTYYSVANMHRLGRRAARKYVSAQQSQKVERKDPQVKSFWGPDEW
jgi:isochorismate hydrolase